MAGVGRMTWNNSDVYHGEWRYNKANGKGIFVDNQGSTYNGEWVDDQQHGLGFESWENGAITFRGMYTNGKRTDTANSNGQMVLTTKANCKKVYSGVRAFSSSPQMRKCTKALLQQACSKDGVDCQPQT